MQCHTFARQDRIGDHDIVEPDVARVGDIEGEIDGVASVGQSIVIGIANRIGLGHGDGGCNQIGQWCDRWVILQNAVIIGNVAGRCVGGRQRHNVGGIGDFSCREIGGRQGVGEFEVGGVNVARFQRCGAGVDDGAEGIGDDDVRECDVAGVGDREGINQLVALIGHAIAVHVIHGRCVDDVGLWLHQGDGRMRHNRCDRRVVLGQVRSVGLVADHAAFEYGFGKGNVFDLPCFHIFLGDGVGHRD